MIQITNYIIVRLILEKKLIKKVISNKSIEKLNINNLISTKRILIINMDAHLS